MMEVGGERQAGDMGQGGPWRCQSRGEPVSGPWSCVPPGKVPGGLGQKSACRFTRTEGSWLTTRRCCRATSMSPQLAVTTPQGT